MGHLVIFSNNLIDFIDSFNVTVKWIETLFPESKPEVDKIYSDVQSFGKAMQSNLYVYALSIPQIVPDFVSQLPKLWDKIRNREPGNEARFVHGFVSLSLKYMLLLLYVLMYVTVTCCFLI